MKDQKEIQSVIRKIQGLLNTTTERGASEAEAASAASLAQRLLLKHGLDMGTVQGHQTEKERAEELTHDWHWVESLHQGQWQWQLGMAHSIASCTCCAFLIAGKGRGYQFIGTSVNVQVAKKLFEWVTRQMFDLGTAARKAEYDNRGKVIDDVFHSRYIGRNFLRSYLLGMANRVSTLLKKEFEENVREMQAGEYVLARIDEAMQKANEMSTGTFNKKSDLDVNMNGYFKGKKDADRVKLNPEDSLSVNLGGPKALAGR